MAVDPTDRKAGCTGMDPKWLLQFYTAAQNTDSTDPGAPQALPDFTAVSEKYQIGGELGCGGMKSVPRALDRHSDRDVAMAVPRESDARCDKMGRFVREARITAALEHPNIVPIMTSAWMPLEPLSLR